MKKFTVYEIEKMTNGKLSKYKLNQAIEKGELVAQKVKGDKKGRGIPKYYITESELSRYFRDLENSEMKKRSLVGDLQEVNHSKEGDYQQLIEEIKRQKNDIINAQNEKFDELRKRIQLLESIYIKDIDGINGIKDATPTGQSATQFTTQPTVHSPTVQFTPQSTTPYHDRKKQIVAELAQISVFSVKKRKALLQELQQLV